MGDYYVLHDVERSSNKRASTKFQAWACQRGMIDLGFVGASFTWSHGTNEKGRSSTRLDRDLGEDRRRRLFLEAIVSHLPHCCSDHCPLLLELDKGHSIRLGDRPFRFEAAWLLEAGFMEMLQAEGKGEAEVPCALRDLQTESLEQDDLRQHF